MPFNQKKYMEYQARVIERYLKAAKAKSPGKCNNDILCCWIKRYSGLFRKKCESRKEFYED